MTVKEHLDSLKIISRPLAVPPHLKPNSELLQLVICLAETSAERYSFESVEVFMQVVDFMLVDQAIGAGYESEE